MIIVIFIEVGNLKTLQKKVNKDLFSTIKRNTYSDSTLTVIFHNVRSLSKHLDNIVNDFSNK